MKYVIDLFDTLHIEATSLNCEIQLLVENPVKS